MSNKNKATVVKYTHNGKVLLFDAIDYLKIKSAYPQLKITLARMRSTAGKEFTYACVKPLIEGKRKTILLHRFITKCPKGKVVDHINHDTLDNRKLNLRICSQRENLMNKSSHKNSTSIYLGVSYCKSRKLWAAGIKTKDSHINLGRFKSEADAARAYNEAALKYFGEFANINKTEEDNIRDNRPKQTTTISW